MDLFYLINSLKSGSSPGAIVEEEANALLFREGIAEGMDEKQPKEQLLLSSAFYGAQNNLGLQIQKMEADMNRLYIKQHENGIKFLKLKE